MIELIREKPELVKKSIKKRGMDSKIVDDIVKLDKQWRELKGKTDELRARRNKISQEINALKKQGKSAATIIKEASELPDKISKYEEKMQETKKKLEELVFSVPNILHESVPTGKDSSKNKVIKEFGKKTKFSFKPKTHTELLEKHGLADFEKAAKISGSRWYFLKGKLAVLEMALARYAVDFMMSKGYEFVIPPYFVNKESYRGMTSLKDFEDVMYKIEGEDLYAIATSEHAVIPAFAKEIFADSNLPKKTVAYSPCFRKEAGTHGQDTKGIFRVHQFDKVEQLIVSTPEESWKLHEEMLKNAIEFWKTLEIPFRQVLLCSGDTGIVMAKTYDLDAWFPAAQEYQEAVSCSNATKWQSSKLGIKCETNPGVNRRLAHTLNSTCVAIQRCLAAIIENNQQKDGSITIPKVLHKYTCFKVIK